MTRVSSVVLFALALASAGCLRDPTETQPPGAALVSVTRVESGIRLTNNTDRGVAYVISDPAWLGLLAICIDPGPGCVKLAPGASVVVPHSEIHGYATGTKEVQVTWWHVVPDASGGHKAEQVVTVTVPL